MAELKRPKYGGRKKGTPNQTTAKIREAVTAIVGRHTSKVNEDLAELEPIDRIKMIIELCKFVLPTLKAQDIKLDSDVVTELTIKREIIDKRDKS